MMAVLQTCRQARQGFGGRSIYACLLIILFQGRNKDFTSKDTNYQTNTLTSKYHCDFN